MCEGGAAASDLPAVYTPGVPYFRCMTPDADGLPRVGDTGRTLGVRVPEDLPVEDGFVRPASGGMSVAPRSLWNLPPHRRPRALGRGSTGSDSDRVYEIAEISISAPLAVRPDPEASEVHAFVEPATRMKLHEYRAALNSTRPSWAKVVP